MEANPKQVCPICKKSKPEQMCWRYCEMRGQAICEKHCWQGCKYWHTETTLYHCSFGNEEKHRNPKLMKTGEMKEILYHFKTLAPFTHNDIIKILRKHSEYRDIRFQYSDYHIRLQHRDDFVLCRAMDEFVRAEEQIIAKQEKAARETEQ